MNVQTIIAAACIIAALVWHFRKKPEEAPEEFDAAELADAIRALQALSEQLENADRMLADLNACNPRELLRGFRAQWCGLDGKQRKIDFMADGVNQTTAGLKAAAQEERERLNGEIIATIRAMQTALDSGSAAALFIDAVGETVDETSPAADVGEW